LAKAFGLARMLQSRTLIAPMSKLMMVENTGTDSEGVMDEETVGHPLRGLGGNTS
jgi:hypothetical protein